MMLETKRLILRPPKESDWADLVEGAKDLEVSRNLQMIPHPYSKKDAMSFIRRNLEHSNARKNGVYNFFIELKSDGKVIGVTSVDLSKGDKNVGKTGSWINKKYWRKGYMLEAKVAVLDFAFTKLKLRKIETAAFTENTASNKMSRKLGFKQEGTKRQAVTALSTGKVHDEHIYGLLKKEWKERRPYIVNEVNMKAARSP